MNLDVFKSKAPALPEFSARYRAIYFEPMAGSGEQFTIGIMAQATSGEYSVLQTLADKTLNCMYGQKSASVKNLVFMILDSATRHLSAGRPIEEWQPPMSGVIPGEVQASYSNNGLEGILFQGITSYSSLYKGALVDDAINEINGDYLSEEDEAEQKNISLIQQVKTIFTDSGWPANRWKQEVIVKDNARISIDYLGVNYNANLSNFDVKRIKPAFNAAKAKLFDLDVLREKRQHELITSTQNFELLIALKNSAPAEAQDHFQMLEQLADSIQLRVIKKATPKELAERIIQQERAA